MKNENVHDKVCDYQNNEKIEDQCPPVCTSVRERIPYWCPLYYPGTWEFWKIVFNTRLRVSCCCIQSLNQSDSGDSGRWNVASISIPQSSSSDSLNLSCDNAGELCSERGVADWVLGCNNMGRGGSSTSSLSSSSTSSGTSWLRGGSYAASS